MRFTHFPPVLTIVIGFALVFGGYEYGRHSVVASNTVDSHMPSGVSFDLFWETWNKLHADYVGSIDNKKLTDGAVDGMVNAVGDPYTIYLDPQSAKELDEGLQGAFSGIGAELGVQNHQLVVTSTMPDSPSAKAGIKALDVIIKVDGQATADMSLADAVRKIRGQEGTKVVLTVIRDSGDPQDISVTRGQITVKSVNSTVRPDHIGYLQITAFHEDTLQLTKAALQQFIDAKVTGVVIDLRGNPGGLLESGVDITSLFLKNGTIVKQKDKNGTVQTYQVSQQAMMPDTPLVILVDKGSASAAEIMAGALQDYNRAKLVGDTTYGKGSVQQLEDLSNGGQLKVTIAQWLTPKDRQITGKGIDPDVKVERSDAEIAANKDPQLDRAVSELKK